MQRNSSFACSSSSKVHPDSSTFMSTILVILQRKMVVLDKEADKVTKEGEEG